MFYTKTRRTRKSYSHCRLHRHLSPVDWLRSKVKSFLSKMWKEAVMRWPSVLKRLKYLKGRDFLPLISRLYSSIHGKCNHRCGSWIRKWSKKEVTWEKHSCSYLEHPELFFSVQQKTKRKPWNGKIFPYLEYLCTLICLIWWWVLLAVTVNILTGPPRHTCGFFPVKIV